MLDSRGIVWLLILFLHGSSFLVLTRFEIRQDDRIDKGKVFLSQERRPWLDFLRQAPFECVRVSVRSKHLVENWYSTGHSIRVYHKEDGSQDLLMKNPKYVATLTLINGKPTVTHVSPAPATEPFPDSPLNYLSTSPEGPLFTSLYDGNRIEITDFESFGTQQTIKFVPKHPSLKWAQIELRFNSPSIPIPEKRIVKYLDGTYHLESLLDFEKVGNLSLPQKLGILKSSTRALTFDDQPTEFVEYEYGSDEVFDESRCYFSYYGLNEPHLVAAADFSQKNSNFNLTLWIAVFGIAICLLLLWRKNQRDQR